MEFDLQRGLRDLGGAPSVGPDTVPTDLVLRRVRRGRALRTAGIGVAAAAVIVGAVVAVVALPRDPVPPADTPTPAPEVTTTPAPTPFQTPEPTEAESEPAVVAVTVDGTIVRLNPETGTELGSVVPQVGLASVRSIALSPDGLDLYTTTDTTTILRISLHDGAAQEIATGVNPSVSPDGTTLAYIGPAPGTENPSLNLLDIASGVTRHSPIPGEYQPATWIGEPSWTSDGSLVAFECCFDDAADIAVTDPRAEDVWSSAEWLHPAPDAEHDGIAYATVSWRDPVWLADGRLAVRVTDAWDENPVDDGPVAVVDPAIGTPHVLEALVGTLVSDIAARPDGQSLLVLTHDSTLLRWDDDGSVRELATGIAAVAW